MATKQNMGVRFLKTISKIFVLSVLAVGCKKQQSTNNKPLIIKPIEWNAAMSCPANYPVDGPHIFYFFKGKLINVNESLTGIGDGGWVYPSPGRSVNEANVFPDSVAVQYGGLNEKLQMCIFAGGKSLPVDKIKQLFKEGYEQDGERKEHHYITTGMAPGGRVCVWVDFVEIARFSVSQKQIYFKEPVIFGNDVFKAKTIEYLAHHSISYGTWDKPATLYDLDFGFCSQENAASFFNEYFFTKEGFIIPVSTFDIDNTDWDKPYGEAVTLKNSHNYQPYEDREIRNKKLNIPIHGVFEWKDKNKQIFSTDVILPKDFEKRFSKAYINPETGKETHFNRIILGVEKDGIHAIIWLDGLGRQEKIMRFKGNPEQKDNDKTVNSGGYATEVTLY